MTAARAAAAALTVLCLLFADAKADDTERDRLQDYDAAIKAAEADFGGKAPPDRIFFINLIAGRDLMDRGRTDLARPRFEKALALEVNEDKTEAYVSLLGIGYREKDVALLKHVLPQAKAYFDKYPRLRTPPIKSLLELYEAKVAGRPVSQEALDNLPTGFERAAIEDEMSALIRRGNFPKALSMMNRAAMKKPIPINTKVTYDLLNVLVHRKAAGELFCEPTFRKYPGSRSYSTMICGILLGYLASGKTNAAAISELDAFLKEHYPWLQYLGDAVKRL